MHNKGFALVEVLLVMTVLSLLVLFVQYANVEIDTAYHYFTSDYLYTQSQAMLESQKKILESYPSITFNEKGNVNGARTISFANRQIVVELGGGRLVHR